MWLFVAGIGVSPGQEPQHYFLGVSTLMPRPLAMGGAFNAVDDDLAALLYNPATFSLYRDQRKQRLTFFLNPLAPGVALDNMHTLFKRGSSTWEEAAAAAALLLKGMTLSLGVFEFGALFGEQAPRWEQVSPTRVFAIEDYVDNQYNILAARLHVAERVSLAGSMSFYYQKTDSARRQWGIGSSYGVQVRPARAVAIGVSYVTLPKKQREYREEIERLVNGAINLGLSVRSNFGTTLAADIRDLGDEKALTGDLIREVHVGVEQILLSHVALRAGAFRKRDENAGGHYIFSGGFGLIDANRWWNVKRRFTHANWVLNYGVLAETLAGQRRFLHTVSLLFRL